MRSITFQGTSFEEFTEWQMTDKKIFAKIAELITEIRRTPFEGKGKPEALKHELQGKWSRRITQSHRLVYEVRQNEIIIHSCKFHYE